MPLQGGRNDSGPILLERKDTGGTGGRGFVVLGDEETGMDGSRGGAVEVEEGI